MANTIQQLGGDPRISSQNQGWAQQIYIPPDKRHTLEMLVTAHPVVVDRAAEQYRQAYGTSIGTVGEQIIEDLNGVESVTEMTGAAGSFGLSVITSPIMLIFCIILMAYAVIKVFFSNLKRGGILLIQIAVGSLYMFSIPRGYTDGFIQWIKQVIGLCLTAFLQSTILVAGLMVFKDHALLGLGLMLSAGEVPRIAGTFGLDTTTRANIMSAVYTAQAAVNTTRTIVQAVAGK